MAIPVVPLLKLIALGSIKIVLLGIGALTVPVFTVRLVLGGTGESIRMATQWMVEHDKLDPQEADVFFNCLSKVQQADFTRAQARGLLFAKIRKTASGTVNGVRSIGRWILGLFGSKSAS